MFLLSHLLLKAILWICAFLCLFGILEMPAYLGPQKLFPSVFVEYLSTPHPSVKLRFFSLVSGCE